MSPDSSDSTPLNQLTSSSLSSQKLFTEIRECPPVVIIGKESQVQGAFRKKGAHVRTSKYIKRLLKTPFIFFSKTLHTECHT